MVNNVIGVVNNVIAAGPSLLNFMIADSHRPDGNGPDRLGGPGRSLFQAMGMKVMTTERPGDGGIDVRAMDPDPIRGGKLSLRWLFWRPRRAGLVPGIQAASCRAPAAACRASGGLPGGLVAVGAGTFQPSLGVLGAGVLRRRGQGLGRRWQLGLFSRGVLADLGLPVRGVAGPVRLRAGRPGSLPRPGRLLLGSPGAGLGFLRPVVRAGHRKIPLLLYREHPILSGPSGLGNPALRGFPRCRGRLLGCRGRSERLRQ